MTNIKGPLDCAFSTCTAPFSCFQRSISPLLNFNVTIKIRNDKVFILLCHH
nr:MAG TPA: hypothetical protein [Caudoviricetes sp.]